jgi:methyltransferase (TIGR00027 family)
MSFGVGMRTRLLDALVRDTISAHAISTVLSVGAGLDTRPWRLDLPAPLRWVEVDLPDMLEYKSAILEHDRPVCQIERLAADLNDTSARAAILAAAGSGPALLITEGLLSYLSASTIDNLAAEAAASPSLRCWLLDVATGALSRAVRMTQFSDIEALRAPDNIEGEQILEALSRHGWADVERRTYAIDGMKALPPGRLEAMSRARPAGADVPPPPPSSDLSGLHLLMNS